MLPKVAIIGRPNVGKSSLLNMLAGRRVSIVDPTAGVTRDRVAHLVELPPPHKGAEPRHCELIDTGGYGVYADDAKLNVLAEDIEHQIGLAVREANLVLFVIDAQTGLTPLDHTVADLLRRAIRPQQKVVLVANKVDHERFVAHAAEAASLGFGEPVCVSANTAFGKMDLLDEIERHVDFDAAGPPPAPSEMLLAIIGCRNAGKSTLVNALAGAERVIASELPGTTRDSVDVRFEIDGRTFTAIDTAGMRKRKSIENDIEYYSHHRALRAIRRADVVMLVIDARLRVSQVDKHLSGEIVKHHKPCVIVINKWDLVEKQTTPDAYLEYLGDALRALNYAPIVFVSAKNNDHVREAALTACELFEQSRRRVSTGQLNQVLQDILAERGPTTRLGKEAKIYYVTMPDVQPPTIVLFVNHVNLFDQKYQRYMINRFRERLPYAEVPIKLIIRPRRPEHAPGERTVH